MPLLSIIITVYNLKDFVAECIDSVVKQDFDDYEIVLVDNGSTDGSRKICQEYADKYKQIRYIQLDGVPILGRAHAVGLIESKGTYVHMVDGDDYLLGSCYPDIIKVMREQKPDVIMGSFTCHCEDGAVNTRDAEFDASRINGHSCEEAIDYLCEVPNFHFTNWRFIFNKQNYMYPDLTDDLVKKSSKKDNKHGDEATAARVLVKAKSIYFYDKPFYCYRKRKSSVSSTVIHPDHYLNAMIGHLHMLSYYKLKGSKKRFMIMQIEKMLKLFTSNSAFITHKQIYDAAQILKKNRQIIKKLRVYLKKTGLESFYQFIEKYGEYEGLYLYCAKQKCGLLSKIEDLSINYYVFPTGNSGEATAKILEGAGIDVKGFLDNDPAKDGLVFNNIKCSLPSKIKILPKNELDNTAVVISTIYAPLVETFRQQLKGLGIKENNIIVKG
ncbi:MAG TPA: glycosyltransferase family 2 protein [Ruminiclostridium sp.]|nr:glycosyltransferase family 2 protein [Ruminiclostridium sp.]